jgi:hypothetical protein
MTTKPTKTIKRVKQKKLTREEFCNIYYNNLNKDVVKILKITFLELNKLLDSENIQRKPKGIKRKPKIILVD